MKHITTLFIILFCLNTIQANKTELLLKELDSKLSNREYYMNLKEKRVDSLKRMFSNSLSLAEQYVINRKIYDEYANYNADLASQYIFKNKILTDSLNNPALVVDNKLCYAELLSTSGLIKEAMDIIATINRADVSEDMLSKYYETLSWVYRKASTYANDSIFAPNYLRTGQLYTDSAYIHTPPNTIESLYLKGYILMERNEIDEAEETLLEVYNKTAVNTRIYAIITYYLSTIYKKKGDIDGYEEFLIRSAISDQECALKENLALQSLAFYLYQYSPEDLDRAHKYIQLSMSDAQFYNNRVRAVQIGQKLPIIVSAFQDKVDSENGKLKISLVIISLLALLTVATIIYIYGQVKVLNSKQDELRKLNTQLTELNADLHKANKTKEEYVSIFADLCSSYIDQMDRYRKMVAHKIAANQINDLINTVKSSEKMDSVLSDFFQIFDKSFLNLYPNFIKDLNALLHEKEQIVLKDGELLNSELRIFALIRLGISNSSSIALFLRYSPQTIYNYRTRIRNKAINRESFEEDIMEIGI